MAAIALQIVRPASDQRCFVLDKNLATMPVSFQGKLLGAPEEGLYYRWYSSLNTHAQRNHYALQENPPNDTVLRSAEQEVYFELGMGSHVVTFAATDQPGESAADTTAVRRGGVTGGAEGSVPCVIHIFKARILDLDSPQPAATLLLVAEAPWDWLGAGYRTGNRLHYRWVLEPNGAPPNRTGWLFKPAATDLSFVKGEDACRVVFTPPQPLAASGNYDVKLFVGDPGNAAALEAFDSLPLQLTP